VAALSGAASEPGRPRLLALRALGLGDLLTAVPALRALAHAVPDHRLELAAPTALTPLVELIGGGWGLHPAAPLAPLDPALAGPQLAVNLHGRGPQSHRVLRDARPGRLIAFAHEEVPESAGGPRWRPGEPEVERWCRLLRESDVPADPRDLALDAPAQAPPPAAVGATLIHPGAGSRARRWPLERFAAVARAERAAGRPVAVTGSRAERDLAARLVALAGLPGTSDLSGATDLAGLAACVAAAERVICGDTGIAHLATSLGTPSVVLFGPTSPREWGPPVERARHRVLWRGRRGDPHADRPDPGLLEIEVEEVLDALAAVPGRASAVSAG
jgi:ADP-heptose:LPS heptosyltransferase